MSIDYGMGKTNINLETGIRFGFINGNKLAGDADETILSDGVDLEYKELKDSLKNFALAKVHEFLTEFGMSEWANNPADLAEEMADLFSLDGIEYEGGRYIYKRNGYTIETHSDYTWVILKSPYYTTCRLCSPCCPGGGDLSSPDEDGYKTYCLGPEWFDEYKPCPYKIHEVSDAEL